MNWHRWPKVVLLLKDGQGWTYRMEWQQYVTMNYTRWRWVWLRAFIGLATYRFWPKFISRNNCVYAWLR